MSDRNEEFGRYDSGVCPQVIRSGGGSGSGGEASVVCAAVACVCGVGCALSLCRARPPPPLPPDRVSSTAQRDRHVRYNNLNTLHS